LKIFDEDESSDSDKPSHLEGILKENFELKEMIKELIDESKIFERRKKLSNYNDKMFHDACKRLEYIVSMKDSELINIFKFTDDEEDSQDIEFAILRAFLDCKY
jgi:hypothetical protein